MMRILVTGASGFVGTAAIRSLAAAGHMVHAASRHPDRLAPLDNVQRVTLPDLSGAVDWSRLTSGMDVVIHLAGIASREGKDDPLYDTVIRKATEDLAASCRENGVKRLIFVSSIGAQAGSSSDRIVSEDDEPRPETAYDKAKLAAEEAVRRSGAPFVILRPVVIYGPNAKANISMLLRIAALPIPLPFGSFQNKRSYVALDNVVQALEFCLDGAATQNETFIVADPEPVSLRDLFTCLRQAGDRSPQLLPVPAWTIRTLMMTLGQRDKWEKIGGALVASSGKLQRAGWHPRIGTKAGFAAMVRSAW